MNLASLETGPGARLHIVNNLQLAIDVSTSSEMKLTADEGPLGEKGETVSAQAHCKVVSVGRAMLMQAFAGPGAVTWLVSYDAKSKRIRTLETGSAGEIAQGLFFKKDGK